MPMVLNRHSCLKKLNNSEPAINQQIQAVKSRLFKQIDDLERTFTEEFLTLRQKHVTRINKQREEISHVLVSLMENKKEINFLGDHGSNNQLFISLRKQVGNIQRTEAKIQQMVSDSEEIEITFDPKREENVESLGSLSASTKPCQVRYKPRKYQQAQIKAESKKLIAAFERVLEVKLKTGLDYVLRFVSVTNDNKLLLTNNSYSESKLYFYRDCNDYETEIIFPSRPYYVAVIPGTNTAIVTLPHHQSIQFINTTTMTKGDNVNVGFVCLGVTAGPERVYVGGIGGIIKTLDANGTNLQTIQEGFDDIYVLVYNDLHEQLIVRSKSKLLCITLDGTLVYSKDVYGVAGVTLDRQGNVYFCETNNIQRISSDENVCEEMMNKDDGVNDPFGICFNSDVSKLFVINNRFKSVYVYNACETT